MTQRDLFGTPAPVVDVTSIDKGAKKNKKKASAPAIKSTIDVKGGLEKLVPSALEVLKDLLDEGELSPRDRFAASKLVLETVIKITDKEEMQRAKEQSGAVDIKSIQALLRGEDE